MKFIKEWGKLCVMVALLLAALGVLLWYTSRPVVLNPAELTPAETHESYPGVELLLDITGHQMTMTLENNSNTQMESGASVDQDRNLIETPGVDVLLDGVWYNVPHKTYASAGVGLELASGEEVSIRASMSPYGKLPDGHYRLSFGYWKQTPEEDRTPLSQRPFYVSRARFDIVNGKYVPA